MGKVVFFVGILGGSLEKIATSAVQRDVPGMIKLVPISNCIHFLSISKNHSESDSPMNFSTFAAQRGFFPLSCRIWSFQTRGCLSFPELSEDLTIQWETYPIGR
jgi:hypothetical protein